MTARAKAAAKKTAKVAAKTTKPAAKKTTKPSTKPAAKTTTKPAAKTASSASSSGKRTTKTSTSTLPGLLGDWVQRVHEAAAILSKHPQVDVLARWQGPPVDPAVLDAIEAKLGVPLGEAARNLYLQADGLALVWVPKGEGPRAIRGRPTMRSLEPLTSGGAIALWPVAEVFGLRGAPAFDYRQTTDDGASRWGFDFPGNYYTPAFVRVGDELRVQVGDDHGAAWDGPTVTLDRYLENVLASWGALDARREQFVRGSGEAIEPVPLATLLPSPVTRDEHKLRRALEDRIYNQPLPIPVADWRPLISAALRARDDLVVRLGLQLIVKLGPAAAVIRDELLAYIRRGQRLWEVGDALAALPAEPLARDFMPLLAFAASNTAGAYDGIARALAASLERDPRPEHLAAWLATLTGEARTPYLVALYLRGAGLRAAASEQLRGRVDALDRDPDDRLSAAHYAALAWADLHPEDRRPVIVTHLRHVLADSFAVAAYFERMVDWPVLGECLDAVLAAVAGSGDLAVTKARSRHLARRGPAIVAALRTILADEEPGNRYIRDVILREVAPELPLDAATRARVAALLG